MPNSNTLWIKEMKVTLRRKKTNPGTLLLTISLAAGVSLAGLDRRCTGRGLTICSPRILSGSRLCASS